MDNRVSDANTDTELDIDGIETGAAVLNEGVETDRDDVSLLRNLLNDSL